MKTFLSVVLVGVMAAFAMPVSAGSDRIGNFLEEAATSFGTGFVGVDYRPTVEVRTHSAVTYCGRNKHRLLASASRATEDSPALRQLYHSAGGQLANRVDCGRLRR